jgi:aspartyl/asparaginyl beta-hydroxylase (cupin superfamily)
MTGLFVLTGVVVWALLALMLAGRLLRGRGLLRPLYGRTLLPYTMVFKYRATGWIGAALKRLRVGSAAYIAPEVIDAHRAVTLSDTERLRDVLVEMDKLPTIQTGMRAIGVTSMIEVASKRVNLVPSPYTHPMQYPPYYIPGVPARNFSDPSEFEWTRILEHEYPAIKRELMQVLNGNGDGFKGYMSEAQHNHRGWNTFNFFFYGKKFEENCERCPHTTAVLESLPRFERDHIMFSSLNPHTRIPPHVGPMNGILRAHLGLVVPQGCYIRVGSDERTWEEGKVLVFDDSFEHEVFNHSENVRIVLFMNFWHPCFSEQEISVLERFRAAYERSPLSMVHAQNQAAKRAHDMEVGRVSKAAAA